MPSKDTYRVLIAGGGTGGHVFPAIAIADAIRMMQPGTTFLFVGALGRLEMEKVPEAGYMIEGLPVMGLQRRLTYKNLIFPFRLLQSLWRSGKILRKFQPHVAVGVGGYASGPVLRQAVRKKIPVLIQEQNSYAGLTNRLLAKSARRICVAYEQMEKFFPAPKIVITGNPVRDQIRNLPSRSDQAYREFRLEQGRKVILVLGGSLGARTLNRSLMEGLGLLDREDVQLLWQCGKHYLEEAEARVRESGMKNVQVQAFISRMDLAYSLADIIVSRAGAISISELCLVGKPAILIPSPNVAEDHQTRNAEALVNMDAALMIRDEEAEKLLVSRILNLSADEVLKDKLSKNIRKMGIPDAAERIANEILQIVEEK